MSTMPDTTSNAIGRRLRTVREIRGLTQAYVATVLDFSPQRWGNYERGLNVPRPDSLARFCQLSGATADYLLFGRMEGLPFELAELLRTHENAATSADRAPKAG